ncbi:MAG: hypothetical protein RR068_15035, partial [Hafnia sp.]
LQTVDNSDWQYLNNNCAKFVFCRGANGDPITLCESHHKIVLIGSGKRRFLSIECILSAE